MFKNYLLTALRNLWRNKVYAFVSIFGLALGISCTLLIALYIQDELSYEDFQENKSRIYRLSLEVELGSEMHSAASNMAAGPTLVDEYPEIEKAVRIYGMSQNATVRVGDINYQEPAFIITDSTFFDIFSFDLIHGSADQVLRKPNSLVLTKSISDKYFGDKDPLGQELRVNNKMYVVDGVVQDPPLNTEIQFAGLRAFSALPPQMSEQMTADWYWMSGYTYLLTTPEFDRGQMDKKLDGFYKKYIIPFQEANSVSGKYRYHFDPLDGLHFNNTREFDLPRGNIRYIYVFSAVALFILLIACINFINLTLAQSSRRGREVGVRKTLGAHNSSIRWQFLGESFVIVFIALITGLALVEMLLPAFNDLTGKMLATGNLISLNTLAIILAIFITVGLLSGFYPALVLSRLDPIRVLKGKSLQVGKHSILRRVLVVVQFVFSIGMIIGTAVVFEQFQFMKNKDMGFNKDQVAMLQLPADTSVYLHSTVFQEELSKITGISNVSNSGQYPGNSVGELLFRIENEGRLMEKGIKFMSVDEHFLDLYEIKLTQGRNFRREMTTDPQSAFIINETAARQFGWTDKPLGKRMQWGLEANDQATNDGQVIGMVKDFNFQSLHNPIEPFVFIYNIQPTIFISFRIASGQMEPALEQVQDLWSNFAPKYNMNLKFVDEQFALLYATEERMITIFGYFAIISIFIACLGLFALSAFTIEQRIREIGIRKILGASIVQIIRLLGKEFLVLVLIAAIIALPLSYYYLNIWLSEFAYHISINTVMMLVVVLFTLILALTVISYHAFRAARANPVDALRFE